MRKLESYSEFLNSVLKTLCQKTLFSSNPSLKEIVKENRMVVVVNHATPLSWIPAMCLLATKVAKAGGGDRVPMGIVDKWFYSNPLTTMIAVYLTQSEKFLNFDQLILKFKKTKKVDLVVFPEGAHSFFEMNQSIKTFRSSRFIELAIKTDSPILLAVHKGSETWSKTFPVPAQIGALIMAFSEFFGKKILEHGSIGVPWIDKMDEFKMHVEFYNLSLKQKDLKDDLEERKAQLKLEAEKIKIKMQEIWNDL
jgi:hypothetical protein